MIRRAVWVQVEFEAVHAWPECDVAGVGYLRSPHRHVFKVVVKMEVANPDREVEFISLKHWLTERLRERYEYKDLGRKSCEDIALEIFEALKDIALRPISVSVSEDGENGAEVWESS